MTPSDIPQLSQALSTMLHSPVTVTEAGHQLVIQTPTATLQTPPTLHYKALDWREWLHRARETLQ